MNDPMKCPCMSWVWADGLRLEGHHPKCDGTGQWKAHLLPTDSQLASDLVEAAREFANKFYETNRSLKFETELQLMADFANLHASQQNADLIARVSELEARTDSRYREALVEARELLTTARDRLFTTDCSDEIGDTQDCPICRETQKITDALSKIDAVLMEETK